MAGGTARVLRPSFHRTKGVPSECGPVLEGGSDSRRSPSFLRGECTHANFPSATREPGTLRIDSPCTKTCIFSTTLLHTPPDG